MIRKTRIKFVIVTMAIIVVILLGFCSAIIISIYNNNHMGTEQILRRMAQDFERFPMRPESPSGGRFNEVRSFMASIDENSEIIKAKFSESFYTEDDIKQYVTAIKSKGSDSGTIGSIRYLVTTSADGRIIVGIDNSLETSLFNELAFTVLIVGVSSTIVLFGIVWLLSYWVIKPTETAFKRQKQFISNAGHELKTPLTIISAGVDLLEKQIEERSEHIRMEKWISNIKTQAEKMDIMVSDLLSLAKIEEFEAKKEYLTFDISKVMLSCILPFESVAFEQDKNFSYNIPEHIFYKGNQKAVKEAVDILIDNALKHSDERGTVRVSLKLQGTRPILSVFNTGNTIIQSEVPSLFERFYRSDSARAKGSGSGSGLGLAIVKALCEQHKWHIDVTLDKDCITFILSF